MRNFYLSLAVALLPAITFAQKPVDAPRLQRQPAFTTVVKAPRAPLSTDIQWKQPEGTLHKNMYRKSVSLYQYFGSVFDKNIDGHACNVVDNEKEGTVYLDRPFGKYPYTGWIKGKKAENDTVLFTFPQPVYKQYAVDEYGDPTDSIEYAYAMRMYKQTGVNEYGDSTWTYVPDPTSQTVKFVWHGDTLVKADTAMVGLAFGDGSWTGYGDTEFMAFPVKDKVVTAPAGATPEDFSIYFNDIESSTRYVRHVKAVVDNKEIYLKGLEPSAPEAWVKGDIANGKASFRKQYLGVDTLGLYQYYFYPAVSDTVVDEFFGETYVTLEASLDVINFDYDAASKTLKSDDVFAINAGQGNLYETYVTAYNKPVMKPFDDILYKPAKPVLTFFKDYTTTSAGRISFNLPNVSEDGEILALDRIYYHIFLDDEVLTFTPEEYKYITKDITDIPYTFSDAGSYDISAYGAEHNVYFYVAGLEKVGVQSFYKSGDDVEGSDILWVNIDEYTSINNLTDTGAATTARTIAYRDLSGRLVTNPGKGIYLKTVALPDGSLKTFKVVKK